MGQRHFISAGAGSGKTHRLTQILYRELGEGRAQPAQVVATTFTRKAATELRERVRQHLLSQREFRLANAMGEARIGTVNAVCGGLIQRFAFEAGLPPEQRVLDEGPAELLVREAIDEVTDAERMRRLVATSIRLGIKREEWQKTLREIMQRARVNDVDPERLAGFGAENAADLQAALGAATGDDLEALLRAAIETALPEFDAALAKQHQKNIADPAQHMREVLAALEAGRMPWGDWLKLAKGQPAAVLRGCFAPVAAVAGRVALHPGLREDLRTFLTDLFGLAAAALGAYAARKRVLGALDFADQEYLLLKLLDDPRVAAMLADELDVLLVDEFQDTSPIQLALFVKLAAFAKRSYWVGDIKQAIYGFRGSDTALMEAVLESLRADGDEPDTLGTSRRSRPELVGIVNAAFVPAFAPRLAPEAVRLAPVRNEPLDGPAFGNWALPDENVGTRLAALATGIRRLVESGYEIFDRHENRIRPVRHGDIALLCRSNKHVETAAAALRMAGLPWATEQPGLLKTTEAKLALACLRRLNDPADTLATAEIVALTAGGEPEDWVAERLRYLEAGGDPERWRQEGEGAHPLIARLAVLRAQLPVLTPREALELIIAEGDLAGIVLRWTPTEAAARVRIANLEALVLEARDYEEHCRNTERAATIAGFLLWLDDLAKEEMDTLAAPAIDAVAVLTHHRAKGLEWPVVILFDLGQPLKTRLWGLEAIARSPIDARAPLADRFIRYWPWPFGAQKTVDCAAAIEASALGEGYRVRAIEEELRMLYVSMTRARDLMILAMEPRSSAWLDLLQAPWLRLPEGAATLRLPDGRELPAMRWDLEVPETGAVPREAQALFWFAATAARGERLPLRLLPSAAEATTARIIEQLEIGTRIVLRSSTDMAALGNALHACVGADLADPAAPLTLDEVGDLLAGHGLDGSVDPAAVARQLASFRAWLGQRWPDAQARTEVPVESRLPNGQILKGRIDLLLRTRAGFVLVDHKASAQPREKWPEVAAQYAGQLAAYAEAIERASGEKVIERWLFFPVAAGAVRVEVAG